MPAGQTDSGLYLVKFSNGYVRAKMPRKRPKRRVFSCRGSHAPPVSVKAHTAPYVRTQAGLACVLVGSVPLHPEFFDELLLSRNIHSFKLFLIELFDDQLYR